MTLFANQLLAQTDTAWLMQLLTAGGWPGMVILGLLVLMSLVAVALIVEQSITLRRESIAPRSFSSHIAKQLSEANGAAALSYCGQQENSLSAVVRAGLLETDNALSGGGWSAVEDAMQSTLHAEAARYQRRIDYLSVIGNLAPMLGLLGTVVGMIFAFREVATTQGAATAGELASGIYQALVTTVGGLVVAIPSLAAYAVLRNRIDDRMAEVAEGASRAMMPLKRALHGKSTDRSNDVSNGQSNSVSGGATNA